MGPKLTGRVAIITGAGSGMGAATARVLHKHGASLVLSDISGAEKTIAMELGARVVALHADVRVAADAATLIEAAQQRFGGLDILCNVAGAPGTLGPMNEATDDQFDLMVDVNLRGVFHTMRAAIPALVARQGGAIVNVASMAALIGTPDLSVYGAAKSGVVALTRSAAIELAQRGIRVNAVCPGMIDTPMLRKGISSGADGVAYLQATIPLRRFGTPEEIASAILFLVSDDASYITGVALPVAGGMGA